MKKLLLVIVMFLLPVMSFAETKAKPTQHLHIEDVTSMQEAKDIFLKKTLEISAKKEIGLKEASEIHIITYTLEKSVAYFAENLTGEKQSLAKQMAVTVEDIHINSESNQLDELNKHLKTYFELADQFIFCF